jgi:hypothetical protein
MSDTTGIEWTDTDEPMPDAEALRKERRWAIWHAMNRHPKVCGAVSEELLDILATEAMEEVMPTVRDFLGRMEKLREERDEARRWACHGFEIGQRSATWADEGVAPQWLLDSYKPKPPVCKGIEGATGIDCELNLGHPGDHEGNHEPNESIDYPLFVRWPRNKYDGKRVAPAVKA